MMSDDSKAERESMPYDVVIVGAGPAGLSAACRLKQLNGELTVCVLEKGSEVGAHILSGAVLEPRALDELFPDWQSLGAPVTTAVKRDEVHWLSSATRGRRLSSALVPRTMHNRGNYIISLGRFCQWLAEQAEQLGVDIFPGIPAADLVYTADGAVQGVITRDMGVDASGNRKAGFAAGMALHGKYTIFSEGCRGHLGKALIRQFALDRQRNPQHYGLGIKEVWKIPPDRFEPGLVLHTAGWPLNLSNSTGGGFLYQLDDQRVSVGLITDLSYSNPHLNPYQEFQRFKHHPLIKQYLQGSERLSYGARAVVKGGLQSQPRLHFPGGALAGDNAGTLNYAKIKGIHTAMKSGMVTAEVIHAAIAAGRAQDDLSELADAYGRSWAWEELHQQRNFGPAQHKWGTFWGGVYSYVDINLFRGRLPVTLNDQQPDHARLQPARSSTVIDYPRPDGIISFDIASSVYLSNTNHEEDQPCHLQLADDSIPVAHNLPEFDEPAQRYCPAGVYEIVRDSQGEASFQINASNCVHCKTCDIKDPAQNINWVVPEGGGGPNYPAM